MFIKGILGAMPSKYQIDFTELRIYKHVTEKNCPQKIKDRRDLLPQAKPAPYVTLVAAGGNWRLFLSENWFYRSRTYNPVHDPGQSARPFLLRLALPDGRIPRALSLSRQPAPTDPAGFQVELVPLAAFRSDDESDDVQAFHGLGRSQGDCQGLSDDVDPVNGDSHRSGPLLQTEGLVYGLPDGLYAGHKQQKYLSADGGRHMRPM